jgi:hypothetical protein
VRRAVGRPGALMVAGIAASLVLDPPDVHIGPAPAAARLGDATGDGRADLWLAFQAPGIDAAFVAGRPVWPATLDAASAADVRLGDGRGWVSGAIVPNLSADGLADVVRIDHAATRLEVYHGGPDVAARLEAKVADWAVAGIADPFETAFLDLTGDGVTDLLVDRHAIIVGRAGRSGTIDLATVSATPSPPRPTATAPSGVDGTRLWLPAARTGRSRGWCRSESGSGRGG